MGRSEGFFGERVASNYDERAAHMFDPAVTAPVAELLAELAGDGAALEFGIGTDRIAVPFRADPEGLSFDVYDVVTQRFSSQHYLFAAGGAPAYPVEFR